MKTMLLWLGVFGSLFAGATLEGISPKAFLQMHAAILVFGPVLSFWIFSCGLQGTVGFTQRMFSGQSTPKDREIAERLSQVGFLCGGASFIMGMIHMMQNFGTPSQMGTGVAVAFVGMFYGMCPALLGLAFFRESGSNQGQANRTKDRMLYVAASFAGTFLTFLTVLQALSHHV